MGSNMAEQHPVGFQWVVEAKERGAEVIHVDPRFTRTSAIADRHVALRPGTDIVFLGAIVNHILSNGLDFREYVQHIADRRLERIGLPTQYNSKNPFPWMSETIDLGKEKNFFETRVTEYQNSSALSWD